MRSVPCSIQIRALNVPVHVNVSFRIFFIFIYSNTIENKGLLTIECILFIHCSKVVTISTYKINLVKNKWHNLYYKPCIYVSKRMLFGQNNIIIIYHDFLITPRRGSHVKSDKTHIHSHQDNPLAHIVDSWALIFSSCALFTVYPNHIM